MGMSGLSANIYEYRPLTGTVAHLAQNLDSASTGSSDANAAISGASSSEDTGSLASALSITLSQLSGGNNGYSSSFLNSTSLDSAQSLKVFLLTLVEALDPELNKAVSPTDGSTATNANNVGYQNFRHPQATSHLEDSILDLVDAVSNTKKTSMDSNSADALSSLQMSAGDMFNSFGISNSNASLGNLLYQVSQSIGDNPNSGSIINTIA